MKFLLRPLYVVVHTEGSPTGAHGTVESIRRYHIKERGWEDIGYHRVVVESGKVEEGRSVRYQGAGVEGFNSHSLHICVTGNGDLRAFTPPQMRGLAKQVADWLHEFAIPVSQVLGHRECYQFPGVPDSGKTCPGKKNPMDGIRAAVMAAYIESTAVVVPPVKPQVSVPVVEPSPPPVISWWRRLLQTFGGR